MPVMIAPSARQQFFDNQGNVAVGMKLFTYAAGTTTKLSTYTDSTGNTANSNPIVLNAAGRSPSGIWLLDTRLYKFVLAPANDTDPPTSPVWTEDNINVLPGTTFILVVDTIAALKALAPPTSAVTYMVRGNAALGDGFWAFYRWNSADATADNGRTILQPNAGGVGRWNIFGFLQAGAGAVPLALEDKLRQVVHVKDFGAKGDGVTDDTAAIRLAITYLKTLNNASLKFGNGTYIVTDTITLSGANHGISIIGDTDEAMQQGSQAPASFIKFTGAGAVPLFDIQVTYTQFHNLTVANTGNATVAFNISGSGGRFQLHRVCANIDNGTLKRFSDSVVKFNGPFDYSMIDNLESASGAPTIIKISQGSPASASTRLRIQNCVIDASFENMKFVELINGGIENLSIEASTFNTQPYLAVEANLVLVDASAIGAGYQVDNFNYSSINEYDSGTTGTSGPIFDLVRFRNAWIFNNQFQGGGSMVSVVKLTDSVLFIGANTGRSIGGPIVDPIDATSRMFPLPNYFTSLGTANAGMVNNATTPTGIIAITYSAAMVVHPELGHPGGDTTYQIDATNGVAFAIAVAIETNGPPNDGYSVRGQKITVMIRNTSGGALGAVTWNAGQFNLAGAWVSPATGFNRSIKFVRGRTRWIEETRTAADVANE